MTRARCLPLVLCLASCAPPEVAQLTLSGVPADAAALELRLLQGDQERTLGSDGLAQPLFDLRALAPQRRTVTIALAPSAALDSGALVAQVFGADDCLLASGQADWPRVRELRLTALAGCPAKRGVVAPLRLEQVTPARVPAAGGVMVTLRGAGFRPDSSVSFDGQAATAQEWISATELRALAPRRGHERLDGTISVRNGDAQEASARIGYAEERVCFERLLSLDVKDLPPKGSVQISSPLLPPVDVTGDRYPDLVLLGSSQTALLLLPNDGQGQLAVPQQELVQYRGASNTFLRWLGAADVDGDGRPDLLATEADAQSVTLVVRRNLGRPDQPFSTGRSFPEVDLVSIPRPGGMFLNFDPRVGDLNGDGRPDVLLSFAATGSPTDSRALRLLLNQGGRFPSGASDLPGCPIPSWAGLGALADVDGDGVRDALFAADDQRRTMFPDTLGVLLMGGGRCNGWLSLSTSAVVPEHGPQFIVRAGDVDGDGIADVLGNSRQGFVPVLRNAGGGVFPTDRLGLARSVGSNGDLVLFDVNGDGRDDLLISAREDGARLAATLLLAQPGGSYPEGAQAGACSSIQLFDVGPRLNASQVVGATVADMDQDGRPDVIIAIVNGGSGTGSIAVYRNRPAP